MASCQPCGQVSGLNTPKIIVRASDNKAVWSWRVTDPFGAIQPVADPSGLGNFVYDVRFPGQVYDQESGLYYNYFRDYDPQTGRYLQFHCVAACKAKKAGNDVDHIRLLMNQKENSGYVRGRLGHEAIRK